MGLIRRLRAQLESGEVKGAVLRGGIGSLGLRLVSTVLGLLVAMVLARALGAEGYGIYAYVFAMMSLLAMPSQMGLPTIVVRETARGQAHGRWGLVRGLWRWATLVVALMSLGVALLALLGVGLFGKRFQQEHLDVFYCALALVPLVALSNMRGAALRGLRRVLLGQLPESVLRPGLLVVFLLLAQTLLGRELTPALAMGLHAIAALLSFLIGALLLWKVRPAPLREAPPAEYEVRLWTAAIFPLALTAGIDMITLHADIIMLGWFHGSAEVGIFRVVASATSFVGFGSGAIIVVLAPHFARLYAQGETERLQKLVGMGAAASVTMAVPVMLVFVLFGNSLLEMLFGKGFGAGHLTLVLMSIGALVMALMGATGSLLNMTGHERIFARISIISALLNVLLNVLLIPAFGMAGAATASSAAVVFWSLAIRRAIRTHTGLESSILGLRLARRV